MSAEKCVCDNWRCKWVGTIDQALSAPDPFNECNTLYACPKCRDSTLVRACDEPGCNRQVTCGTPTANGYRQTCYTHMPKESKQ